jgi:hypothetical protein
LPKLHELLAVEGDARDQSAKTRAELTNTLDKKRHLFAEKVVTFFSNQPGVEPVLEEQSNINSTIADELRWIRGIWGKAIDLAFQVDAGNTEAHADIVLEDGSAFAENVPATALLQLEKRLGEVHSFIMAIPTLDPAKGFQKDADRGPGYFKAREVRKDRTKKVHKVITKAQATEHHPAQADLVMIDEVVGYTQEQEWSGLITPATKSEYLERVESLKRAVKAARSRANEVEVDTANVKIADKVFRHVFGPA